MKEPVKGLSVLLKDDNTHAYKIVCECTSDDHTVDAWIEIDEDDGDWVGITHYVNTYNPYYKNLWQRIKASMKILFTGVDQRNHEIVLDCEGVKNYQRALGMSINELEQNIKSRKQNTKYC